MKTVVITGISRGIGKALAEKFLKEGYGVIGTSTKGSTDIKNPNLNILTLDLSLHDSIVTATKNIASMTKTIDILLNNAGIAADEKPREMSIAALRKNLEVNLFGLIDFTEQLLPYISPNGQIVNTASVMGSLTTPLDENELDYPAYRISKTAVNMYTKTLASRIKNQGIIVSSVHPGWVKTDMGGDGATREPSVAADEIYRLATTPHETGLFWFDNEIFPW